MDKIGNYTQLFTIYGETTVLARPMKLMLIGVAPETHSFVERLRNDLFSGCLITPFTSIGETIFGFDNSTENENTSLNRIKRTFDSVEIILLLLSHSSVQSPWILEELPMFYKNYAFPNHIPIIPLKLDKVDLPPMFIQTQPVNFYENYKHGIQVLTSFLSSKPKDLLTELPPPDSKLIQISSDISSNFVIHFLEHPKDLELINRGLFEELIAHIFKRFGYTVELTKRTRDGGRDIIAVKSQIVSVKYLIECKRPDPNGYVGISPVRSLYGVLKDERATKALLVTTTRFSHPALQFFERHRWELEPKDFNAILNWIEEYKKLCILNK